MLRIAQSILLVVSALFPIVDPIGGSPVFLSLTLNYDTKTRRLLSRRIAINSFILLVASFSIGSHVLSFFGISLPVVQVGGGMIVTATGWAMLKNRDENDRKTVGRTVSGTDILRDAFYPLTLALTVGPGSISVAVTLGANEPHRRAKLTGASGSRNRFCLGGGNNLSLLCVRRPVSRGHGSDRHERDRKTLVVPSRVHWRPNRLERREPIACVGIARRRSCDISLAKLNPL